MKTFATRSRWLFFALLAFVLTACVAEPSKLWLDAPGWSRGHQIGATTALDPVLPARGEDGALYFLLVADEGLEHHLQFIALDGLGQVAGQWDIHLEAEAAVDEPKLYWSSEGLSAYWIQDNGLYSLKLSEDGQAIGKVEKLSGDLLVNHITTAQAPDGRVEVWFSLAAREGGIYRVDPQGEPQQVAAQGVNPQLQFDQQGGLHAAWVYNEPGDTQYHFFYAYSAEGEYQPGSQREVYATRFSLTSNFVGPDIGFDGEKVYFFWSELVRTGLSAGSTRARFTVLPAGSEQARQEETLYFPYSYHLNYTQPTDWQQRGETAPIGEQSSGQTSNLTDFFTDPESQGSALILALRGRLPYLRNKESSQVALAFFGGEGVESYQLLSFSRTFSKMPAVWSDEQGYLYATWLEAADEGESLYFASTAPAYVTAFSELGTEDYSSMAIDTLLGMFSGLVLIFLPLIWIVAPMIILLLTSPLRRENQSLRAPGVLISLALTLGAYWWSKLAFFPWITEYVPFSAWLPIIPPSWEIPMLIAVPVLIALLGLWAAWNFTFAKDRRSTLFFILIYAGVDGLLTAAIYGVVFYGAI